MTLKNLPETQITIAADDTPLIDDNFNIVGKIDTAKPDYTISFDSSTSTTYSTSMVDTGQSTVTYNTSDGMGIDIGNGNWVKASETRPSELVITDMITKYPGLKIQYEKFMTVYNLIKDDYTYEEPINDGSI